MSPFDEETVKDARVNTRHERVGPYTADRVPVGACVLNGVGHNCLSFASAFGAKFTTHANAVEIARRWNECPPGEITKADMERQREA